MWNLRLGAVYGPDRRPCPLWPLVELFSEDVENKIAELLAPQPRLPTPQYSLQLKHPYPKYVPWPPILHLRSQFQDTVNRFIDNYWDSPQLAAYRRRYPSNPPMVFVDWDDKGRATIDLSRALDSDEDDSEADDSDDEHMSDDSDDDDFCEVCDGVCANVTWYIHPHSYHPQGRNLYSACPACIQLHSISGVVLYTGWD